MKNQVTIGLLFATVSSVCWCVLAIVLKYSVLFVGTGNIVWIRMSTAALATFIILSFKKPQQLKILIKPPLLLVVAAVCLAANYFAFTKGVELTTATNAEIMIQSGTISLMVFGLFFFKEHLSSLQWLGILIAILGFVFVYKDQVPYSVTQAATYVQGNLWLYFGGVTWAVFAALHKKLSNQWNPQQLNLVIYVISAFLLIFTAEFQNMGSIRLIDWIILICLGLNTVIAYGCLGEALKRAPASYVSFVITLTPILTILGVYLLDVTQIDFIADEPIGWKGLTGTSLVILGISIALFKESKKFIALMKRKFLK